MKTLSLSNKKPKKNTPLLSKPKFVFKPLDLQPAGLMAIGICQSNFESFWKQIEKIECSQYEKKQALNKLKEACFWYSKGIAIAYENKEDDEVK